MDAAVRKRFGALLDIRAGALAAFRCAFERLGYTEVSTATLVNIAGSCEDPYLSFRTRYENTEAFLSQSAQLQLEQIVLRLGRRVYSITSSFRAEDFRDPERKDRMLCEFTLIEAEEPCISDTAARGLDGLQTTVEGVIREVTADLARSQRVSIGELGGDADSLLRVVDGPFVRITYDDAIAILGRRGIAVVRGDDLGVREERAIIEECGGRATFVSMHPCDVKFFNMERTEGGCCYSFDLLLPPLGETAGGGLRAKRVEDLRRYLDTSKVGAFIREHGVIGSEAFDQYFACFEDADVPLRAGFGIGFERFVAFIIRASDIVQTVFYQTMRP
jgi:asparaginyl-tRNA synthetase